MMLRNALLKSTRAIQRPLSNTRPYHQKVRLDNNYYQTHGD